MRWPYQFVSLSETERHARRISLNWHAAIAHYSALAPAAALILVRFAIFLFKRLRRPALEANSYNTVPAPSPLKTRRSGRSRVTQSLLRRIKWWLGDDVYISEHHCGQRDQWVAGALWMVWLLALCVTGTGRDYLHLTKRVGAVAASQLPIQYLLALKAMNPFAYVFRSSHEEINRFHRVLGRIIYFLLSLHALLYLNFFLQNGLLKKRLTAPVVLFGVAAYTCLHTMNGAAMASVRRDSYRIFIITHLLAAFVMPPLIFFHGKDSTPARFYVVEAFSFFLLDLVYRRLTTVRGMAIMEILPGTDLIKISAAIPLRKSQQFRNRPGSHVYLSIPPASRLSTSIISSPSLLFEFLHNPFTVADIDGHSGDIVFVARHLKGPVTDRLAQLSASPRHAAEPARIPLHFEGPYGAVGKRFPELMGLGIHRILLVAGGVGATFAVPIYRALVQQNPGIKVRLAWAVRAAGDVSWAMARGFGESILDNDNVDIFVTRNMGDRGGVGDGPRDMELRDLGANGIGRRFTLHDDRKRPNLQRLVDDLFDHGRDEHVAVLVCGPPEMARELRKYVTPWVMKDRRVFWHSEGFGW